MCTNWQHSTDKCRVRPKSRCPLIFKDIICGESHHKLLRHSSNANVIKDQNSVLAADYAEFSCEGLNVKTIES